MIKTVTIIIVLLALSVGGYLMFNNKTGDDSMSPSPSPMASTAGSPSVSPMATTMPSGSPSASPTSLLEVKEFIVVATAYSFAPKEIRVKQGTKVRIVLQNQGGMHDWVIDEFNARTKPLQAGQTETIEFTADKKGTFEYYCSINSHRQMGMKGNLIVE